MCYPRIIISIKKQQLTLHLSPTQSQTYPVSTAKNGIGQLQDTGCTPLGAHLISEKFGDNLPINSVFVARQFTGEIYDDHLATTFPNRDWILTRILWLEGNETGFNGCIRMRNQDIITLYDQVDIGTAVEILP